MTKDNMTYKISNKSLSAMRQERLFFTMVLKDFHYEWDKQTEYR